METLHNDILNTIFKLLSSNELLALRRVSRYFRVRTDQTLFARSHTNDLAIQKKLAAHDPQQYLLWLQNPAIDLPTKLDSFVFAAKQLPATTRLSDDIFDRFLAEIKKKSVYDFQTKYTFNQLLPFMSDNQKDKILDQLLLKIKENGTDTNIVEVMTALLPTLNDMQIVKLIKQILVNGSQNNRLCIQELRFIENAFPRLEIKHKIFAVKFLTDTALNSPTKYLSFIRYALESLDLQSIDRTHVPTFAKLQEYLLSDDIDFNRIGLSLICMIKQDLNPPELTWLSDNLPNYFKVVSAFTVNFLADFISYFPAEVSSSYIEGIRKTYSVSKDISDAETSALTKLSIMLPDTYAELSIDLCWALENFKPHAQQLSKAKLENLITRIEGEAIVIPTCEASFLCSIASALTNDQIEYVLPRIYQQFLNWNSQDHNEVLASEYILKLLETLVILGKHLSESEIKSIISIGIQKLEKSFIFNSVKIKEQLVAICNLNPRYASSLLNEYARNQLERGQIQELICMISSFTPFLTKETATQLIPGIIDNIDQDGLLIRDCIYQIMIDCLCKFDERQIKQLAQALTVKIKPENGRVKAQSLQALDCYLPYLAPKEIIDFLPRLITLQKGGDVNVFANIIPKIWPLLGNEDCNRLFRVLCDIIVKINIYSNNPLNTIDSLQILIPKLTEGWQNDILAIINYLLSQSTDPQSTNKSWRLLGILAKHMTVEQKKEFCNYLIDKLPSNKINAESSLKTFFKHCEPEILEAIYDFIKSNLDNPKYSEKDKLVKIFFALLDHLSPEQITKIIPSLLKDYSLLTLELVFTNKIDANKLKELQIATFSNTAYTQHAAEVFAKLQQIIKITNLAHDKHLSPYETMTKQPQ